MILRDGEAMSRIWPGELTKLTRAATDATFYRPGLTADEISANRRIVDISEATCVTAAASAAQMFAAAVIDDELAGYVIATRHGPDNLELDWLMVHPRHHGTGVARALITAGLEWLGPADPVWLTVIRHNTRAIAFYRKLGFEIDPGAPTAHVVPHWIMRRVPAVAGAAA